MAVVTDSVGGITSYTYDALGNLILTQFPNNTTEARTYDILGRLISIVDTGPNGIIASYQYTLAATGRRDAVVEASGRHVTYGYDALDRLISETIVDLSSAGNRAIAYTYDPVGNRLTRNDTAEGLTTSTYDMNDRLLTETLGITTTYTYDASGDTLSKSSPIGTTLYKWDYDHRMISVDTNNDGTPDMQYAYDPNGIRVSQTTNGQLTRYLIDTIQAYPQVVLEYTTAGAITSYVYGLNLISQTAASTISHWYLGDGLGSTRILTDQSGTPANTYVYDAFGRVILQTGSIPNTYLFAGQQRDAITGLDYLRARYMNVGTGRFVGQDRYPESTRIPASINRYVYAMNEPVTRIDPSGNFSLAELSVSGGIENELEFVFTKSFAGRIKEILRSAADLASLSAFAFEVVTTFDAIAMGHQLPIAASKIDIQSVNYTFDEFTDLKTASYKATFDPNKGTLTHKFEIVGRNNLGGHGVDLSASASFVFDPNFNGSKSTLGLGAEKEWWNIIGPSHYSLLKLSSSVSTDGGIITFLRGSFSNGAHSLAFEYSIEDGFSITY